MDDKHNIEDELNELSPFLSEQLKGRKGGFKVPASYFDKLTDNIIDTIEASESDAKIVGIAHKPPMAKSRVSRMNVFRMTSLAASVTLLLVVGFWMMQENSTSHPYADLEQYNEAQVLRYLDENMDDIGFNDLVETGVIMDNEIDFKDVSQLSDEEMDMYIDAILESDTEEI